MYPFLVKCCARKVSIQAVPAGVSSPDRSWKAGIFSMHEHNPVSTGYRCKELLLGVRYQQELLFFFVFHNGSRHSADDQIETEL